jgi:hypothetical protein
MLFPYKHIPAPYLKSDLEYGYEIIKPNLQKACTKVRSGDNISHIAWLYANYYKYTNEVNIRVTEIQWDTDDKKISPF